MVLQFLLGKSGRLIDVETAELATRFAEYHFLSALHVVQQYDNKNASRIQLITEASSRVAENGSSVTGREVTRSLSKQQRAQFDKGEIAEILSILSQIDDVPGLFDRSSDAKEKSSALQGRRDEIRARLVLNERKRNERRLREVVRKAAGTLLSPTKSEASALRAENVFQLNLPMTGTD
jgi:hypothetical protein